MVKDMAFLLKKYGAKVGATDDFQADVLEVFETLKRKAMTKEEVLKEIEVIILRCYNKERSETDTMTDLKPLLNDYAAAVEAEDTKRLDKLQSLTKGYGKGWILRHSSKWHGMRLHETSNDNANPDVRIAIDSYNEEAFLSKPYQPKQEGGEDV